MLAELEPAPDQVTIAINTNQMNVMELITDEDAAGTSMGEPDYKHAYTEMYYETRPGLREGASQAPRRRGHPAALHDRIDQGPRDGRADCPQGPVYGPLRPQLGVDRRRPRRAEPPEPDGIHQSRSAECRADGRRPDAPRLSALRDGHRHGLARARRPGRQSLRPPRRARDLRPADREDGAHLAKSCGARSRLASRRGRSTGSGRFYSSVDETLEKNGWLPNRKPAVVARREAA